MVCLDANRKSWKTINEDCSSIDSIAPQKEISQKQPLIFSINHNTGEGKLNLTLDISLFKQPFINTYDYETDFPVYILPLVLRSVFGLLQIKYLQLLNTVRHSYSAEGDLLNYPSTKYLMNDKPEVKEKKKKKSVLPLRGHNTRQS